MSIEMYNLFVSSYFSVITTLYLYIILYYVHVFTRSQNCKYTFQNIYFKIKYFFSTAVACLVPYLKNH